MQSATPIYSYEVEFPPGSHGLQLEPVIISSERSIGCRVKGFYFSVDHEGINPEYLEAVVEIGDIICVIEGVSILSMNFDAILTMMKGLRDRDRTIIFKNVSASWNAQDIKPKILPPHIERRSPRVTAPSSPVRLLSSEEYAEQAIEHESTTDESIETVRQSSTLTRIGSTVGSGLVTVGGIVGYVGQGVAVSVGTVVAESAEKLLDETAAIVPRYSSQAMREVNENKMRLLSELSAIYLKLGLSEDELRQDRFLIDELGHKCADMEMEMSELKKERDCLALELSIFREDKSSRQIQDNKEVENTDRVEEYVELQYDSVAQSACNESSVLEESLEENSMLREGLIRIHEELLEAAAIYTGRTDNVDDDELPENLDGLLSEVIRLVGILRSCAKLRSMELEELKADLMRTINEDATKNQLDTEINGAVVDDNEIIRLRADLDKERERRLALENVLAESIASTNISHISDAAHSSTMNGTMTEKNDEVFQLKLRVEQLSDEVIKLRNEKLEPNACSEDLVVKADLLLNMSESQEMFQTVMYSRSNGSDMGSNKSYDVSSAVVLTSNDNDRTLDSSAESKLVMDDLIMRLKSDNEALQSTITTLHDEITYLRLRVNDRPSIDCHPVSGLDANGSSRSLFVENRSEIYLNDLVARLELRENSIASLEFERKELLASSESLKESCELLQSTKCALESELQSRDVIIAKLMSDMDASRKETIPLIDTDFVRSSEEKTKSFYDELNAQDLQLKSTLIEVEELRSSLSTANKNIQFLNQQVESSLVAQSTLNRDIEMSKFQLSICENKSCLLIEEITKLKEVNSRLEKVISEKDILLLETQNSQNQQSNNFKSDFDSLEKTLVESVEERQDVLKHVEEYCIQTELSKNRAFEMEVLKSTTDTKEFAARLEEHVTLNIDLEEKLATCHCDLDRSNNELESLKSELMSNASICSNLRLHYDNLLSDASVEISEKIKLIVSKDLEIEALQQKVIEFQESIGYYEKVDIDNHNLRNELDRTRVELSAGHDDIKSLYERYMQLSDENLLLRGESFQLKQSIADRDRTISSYEISIEKLSGDVNKSSRHANLIQETSQKSIDQYELHTKELTASLENLKQEKLDGCAKYDTLNNAYLALQSEKTSLHQIVDNYSEQLKQSGKVIEQLESDIESSRAISLQNSLSNLSLDMLEKENQNQRINIEELKASLIKMKDEVVLVRGQLEGSLKVIGEKDEQIQKLSSSSGEIHRTLQSTLEDKNVLRQQLEAALVTKSSISEELDLIRAERSASVVVGNELKSLFERLQQQSDDMMQLREEIMLKKQDIASKDRRLLEQEALLDNFRYNSESLSEELSSCKSDLAIYLDRIAQLEDKIAHLIKDNEDKTAEVFRCQSLMDIEKQRYEEDYRMERENLIKGLHESSLAIRNFEKEKVSRDMEISMIRSELEEANKCCDVEKNERLNISNKIILLEVSKEEIRQQMETLLFERRAINMHEELKQLLDRIELQTNEITLLREEKLEQKLCMHDKNRIISDFERENQQLRMEIQQAQEIAQKTANDGNDVNNKLELQISDLIQENTKLKEDIRISLFESEERQRSDMLLELLKESNKKLVSQLDHASKDLSRAESTLTLKVDDLNTSLEKIDRLVEEKLRMSEALSESEILGKALETSLLNKDDEILQLRMSSEASDSRNLISTQVIDQLNTELIESRRFKDENKLARDEIDQSKKVIEDLMRRTVFLEDELSKSRNETLGIKVTLKMTENQVAEERQRTEVFKSKLEESESLFSSIEIWQSELKNNFSLLRDTNAQLEHSVASLENENKILQQEVSSKEALLRIAFAETEELQSMLQSKSRIVEADLHFDFDQLKLKYEEESDKRMSISEKLNFTNMELLQFKIDLEALSQKNLSLQNSFEEDLATKDKMLEELTKKLEDAVIRESGLLQSLASAEDHNRNLTEESILFEKQLFLRKESLRLVEEDATRTMEELSRAKLELKEAEHNLEILRGRFDVVEAIIKGTSQYDDQEYSLEEMIRSLYNRNLKFQNDIDVLCDDFRTHQLGFADMEFAFNSAIKSIASYLALNSILIRIDEDPIQTAHAVETSLSSLSDRLNFEKTCALKSNETISELNTILAVLTANVQSLESQLRIKNALFEDYYAAQKFAVNLSEELRHDVFAITDKTTGVDKELINTQTHKTVMLNKDVENLSHDLEIERGIVADLRRQIVDMEEFRIEKLKLETLNQSLIAELADVSSRFTASESFIVSLQHENHVANTSLLSERGCIIELQAEINALYQRDMESSLLKEELAIVKAELLSSRSRLESLESSTADLNKLQLEAAAQIELNTRLEQTESALVSVEEYHKELKGEFSDLFRLKVELERQIEIQRDELIRLRLLNKQLLDSCASKDDNLASLQSIIDKISEELQLSLVTFERNTKRLDIQDDKYKALLSENNDLAVEVAHLKDVEMRYTRLCAESAYVSAQLDDSKAELSSVRESCRMIENDKNNVIEDFSKQSMQFSSTEASLMASIRSAEDKCLQLSEENLRLREDDLFRHEEIKNFETMRSHDLRELNELKCTIHKTASTLAALEFVMCGEDCRDTSNLSPENRIHILLDLHKNLKEEYDKGMKECVDWESEKAQANLNIALLTESNRNLTSELESARVALKSNQESLIQSLLTNQQLKQEWSALKEEIGLTMSLYEASTKENFELTSKLKSINDHEHCSESTLQELLLEKTNEVQRLETAIEYFTRIVSEQLLDGPKSELSNTLIELQEFSPRKQKIEERQYLQTSSSLLESGGRPNKIRDIESQLHHLEENNRNLLQEREELLKVLKFQSDALIAAEEIEKLLEVQKREQEAMYDEAEQKVLTEMENRIDFEQNAVKTIQELHVRIEDLSDTISRLKDSSQVSQDVYQSNYSFGVSKEKQSLFRSGMDLDQNILWWHDDLTKLSLDTHETLTLVFAEYVVVNNDLWKCVSDRNKLQHQMSKYTSVMLKGLKSISLKLQFLHNHISKAPWLLDSSQVQCIIAAHECTPLASLQILLYDDISNKLISATFREVIMNTIVDSLSFSRNFSPLKARVTPP